MPSLAFSSIRGCAIAIVLIAFLICSRQVRATTFTVSVGDGGFRFDPSSVTIQVGDTVQWNWAAAGHTSTSGTPGQPSGFWDSGFLNAGQTFTFTFNSAGTFPYFCTAHGACCGMVGTVIVAAATPTPSPSATPTPTPTPTASPSPAQSLNVSTRGNVQTGEGSLIGGFIISGTEAKQVIVRGIGPSLSAFGVTGFLADPVLELHDSSGAVIATNDNWKTNSSADQSTIVSAGLNLIGGKSIADSEAVLVRTLTPSSYTAIVTGSGGGTGIGLFEVYDTDTATDGQLANMSTRGAVGTGNDVLIGGFILGPTGDGSATIVVRALGPSLASAGVTDPLLDPFLSVADSNGNTLASNDNWATGPDATTISADNLAPTNASEAAVLLSPAPGAYTAIVSGVNATGGTALVEIYNLQ